MMQPGDPRTAKWRFRWREPVNWAVCGILFILLFFVLSLVTNGFLAFVLSFVPVFCLFFFVLDKRAISIVCSNPQCEKKYVKSNTPWICGFKECRNDNVDEFPFVNRCEHCSAEPKAYECHHCGELIFLTEDPQENNYARCVNSPLDKDLHEEKISKKKQDIELAELKLKKAGVDAELKGARRTLKPKSVKDRLRGKVGSKTELDDEVLRMKAEIDEQFKDDPDERERRHRIIDDEARNLLR